jgi:hypothetical protein
MQYPLAFDSNGNPLDVPAEAVAWRVRRGGGKRGRPRNVFDEETGRQLEIPLASTIDDLIDRGCSADRYRLEAVDAEGRVIPDVVAIVGVPETEEEEDKPTEIFDPLVRMSQLVAQLVDANCRTMEAMASAFGTVRPVQPQAPIVVEQPPPESSAMRPEQLVQTVATIGKVFADAWKTSQGGGAT